MKTVLCISRKGNILLLKNFSLTVPKNIKGCKYKKKKKLHTAKGITFISPSKANKNAPFTKYMKPDLVMIQ